VAKDGPSVLYEGMKKTMRGYLKKWTPRLGLDRWNLLANWHWANRKAIASHQLIGAEASPSWPYMTGVIDFYLPDLAQYDPDDLEEVVVHELVHFVTAEGWTNDDACNQNQERVVTELARAFIRVDRSK